MNNGARALDTWYYLGDELVDDRLLLDANGDGEEAFRLPAVLLPFRIATQRLHLEVGLVLHDAPRQGLGAWRSTFILKKSFQHKEFSVTDAVKLSSAVNLFLMDNMTSKRP